MNETKDYIGATVRVILDTRESKDKNTDKVNGTYQVKLRVVYGRNNRLYRIRLSTTKANSIQMN